MDADGGAGEARGASTRPLSAPARGGQAAIVFPSVFPMKIPFCVGLLYGRAGRVMWLLRVTCCSVVWSRARENIYFGKKTLFGNILSMYQR